MSLQFILGSSGAGKSHYILNNIIQESMDHPEKNYIILVPDQFTLQTQKEMVQMHPRQGILNIDVLSFTRLAYRIFEEIGSYTQVILEETGKNLVLQKIAQEKKEELKVLGANIHKTGYISEMKSLISEFMQYQVGEEEVEAFMEKSHDRMQLYQKLKDIKVVYQEFKRYMSDRFITGEEVLGLLNERIQNSKRIKDSILVLDGFTGFTPVQHTLIQTLLGLCEKVYVTVTMDEREDPYRLGGKHQLFAMSKETIHALVHLAKEEHVMIEDAIWIKKNDKSRFLPESPLGFLESHLFRYGNSQFEKEQEDISIFVSKTPQDEVSEVILQIHRAVRMEAYRYKEIAVVCGDLNGYKDYIKNGFSKAQIPYFLDDKESVQMNPLVEMIRALLDIAIDNYNYESVFRYLRTGMTNVLTEEIDEIENYVIALGVRGRKRWNHPWTHGYHGLDMERLEVINSIRQKIVQELEPCVEVLKQKHGNILSWTKGIYEFLVSMKIQEQLRKREISFIEKGAMAKAKEYAQIYRIVLSLFEKLVEVLGDETVTLSDFKGILDAGLEEAKVGIIPPSADQVHVGDIERTRLKDIKMLFFVGVNDTAIPKKVSKGGILSELDREFLKEHEVQLAPTSREAMYIQKFYLYLNLTKPSNQLVISYCKSSGKGDSIGPAYLIKQILKLYPKLKVRECDEDGIAYEHLCEHIEQPNMALEYVIKGIRQREELHNHIEFLELYTWYKKSKEYSSKIDKIVEAAYYAYHQDPIYEAVAKALYGEILSNSASRLEKFASCAFAHFLQYGLRLQERVQYEFNPADMGNISHKALEWFAKTMNERSYSWKSISKEARENLIDECVEFVIQDYGNTILQSSERDKYTIKRLKRILRRTVWAIQEQVKVGEFLPSSFEIDFSNAEDLQSVAVALSDTQKMKLKGRIDRIDTYEDSEKVYVKIVDYKTGNKNFDIVALYYGLQLQLMVYMNAALELEEKKHPEKEVEPAAAFYYKISDPIVLQEEGKTQEDIEEQLLKELIVNGILQDDKNIICKMDQTLAEGNKKSKVLPVSLKKDGSLTKNNNAISKDQFQILSKFVNAKVKKLGKGIVSGEVGVRPYVRKTETACDYCGFHGICKFDERIEGFAYENLKNMEKEIIWEAFENECILD